MSAAACRGASGGRYYAWRVKPNEVVRLGDSIYSGSSLITYALEVCSGCPVQWACCEFAVETEAAVGTWGTTFDDIRWLQRKKERGEDWVSIVHAAEAADVTVQVAVRAARTAT